MEGADELLRALAHPARRAILRLVWAQRLPAGAVVSRLGLAPASVSEHLKVLCKTGLVTLEREGTWRYYRADRDRLRAITRFLHQLPTNEPEKE